MGKFSDDLMARYRARRTAKRIKWPDGFDGMVIWCPLCAGEIARAPKGTTMSPGEQRLAVDAHNKKCPRRRLKAVP